MVPPKPLLPPMASGRPGLTRRSPLVCVYDLVCCLCIQTWQERYKILRNPLELVDYPSSQIPVMLKQSLQRFMQTGEFPIISGKGVSYVCVHVCMCLVLYVCCSFSFIPAVLLIFTALFGALTGSPLRPQSVDSPHTPVRFNQEEFEDFFFPSTLRYPHFHKKLLE